MSIIDSIYLWMFLTWADWYFYSYSPTPLHHIYSGKKICELIGISDARTPQPDTDLDAETLPVKLKHDACNSSRNYRVHMATWPWASSKGHTKINIILVRYVDVETIPIQLQHHAGNTWWVITFKRQLDLEIVWDFDVETTTIKLQLSLEIQAIYEELSLLSDIQHNINCLLYCIITRSFRMLAHLKV